MNTNGQHGATPTTTGGSRRSAPEAPAETATAGGASSTSASARAGHDVFLAVGATPVERQLIEEWLTTTRGAATPSDIISTPVPTATDSLWGHVIAQLDGAPDDVLLTPVRVSWLPPERDGRRTARVIDLLMGNPRRPGPRRQRLLRRKSSRFTVIAGEGATMAALRTRWADINKGDQHGTSGFARFVVRRAVLAVERAAYRELGAEYKVPRLVREQITISTRFQNLVASLADSTGRSPASVAADAHRYLNEMVAGSSRMFIDFTVQFADFMYRQGYDPNIDVDKAQIETVREYMQRYPALVLPSHRCNLDALVMPATLHEHHLPRTHTFGGINMAIWPIGPLFRLGGTIFIRRDASDNPVYKAMLREYVGYLMEKRFSLQWYVEGGRSRTGKLLPPKLGLLSYVVDAYRDGRTDDVALMPASIAYDQLHDVSDYAWEASGKPKQQENLKWMINYVRAQRQDFGRIYVRFGEPLRLSAMLGTPEQLKAMSKDESRLAMQKIGLEVARRINDATPITGTAMVTLALLAADKRARTLEEVTEMVQRPLAYARRRSIPMTTSAEELNTPAGVQHTLDALARLKVVKAFDGPENLYEIGPEQHVAASYYRNTIVHFFLKSAIIELALVSTVVHPDDDELEATFFAAASRLRDLLKFDFFFRERDAYLDGLRRELDTELPGWRELMTTRSGVEQLIDRLPMLWSPVVFRSIFEAYWVVADALQRQSAIAKLDDKAFLASLPDLGRYALKRGWIRSPEAVSTHLFRPGLDLMRQQGLTDPATPDVLQRRTAMADELRRVLDMIDASVAVGIGRAEPTDLRDVVGSAATRNSRMRSALIGRTQRD
ncbi:MAG: glycerol-3-phosphate 1-O-acyltransferase [Actinomycetota bacterium]|nr:glycerol-3-phosphate 1-O-acyltransferase [Actinomycetota bacterium]